METGSKAGQDAGHGLHCRSGIMAWDLAKTVEAQDKMSSAGDVFSFAWSVAGMPGALKFRTVT